MIEKDERVTCTYMAQKSICYDGMVKRRRWGINRNRN